MAKEREHIPGSRLFGVTDTLEPAEHAGRLQIESHDRLEHLTTVVDQKRTYGLRLRALARVLDEALLAAKNAAKLGESQLPSDGTPGTIAHNLELELRKANEGARRQDRELVNLESELQRERRARAHDGR